MNDAPVFSIILPVYNVEEHLARCYASLQKQSYTNFEMIFVDDCGQDDSVKIIKEYSKYDERIRLLHNSHNLGTFHARERGVQYAKGDYIVFLDPDDELEINFLKTLKEHICNNPSDLVFYAIEYRPKRKLYQPEVPVLPFKNTGRVIEAVFKQKGKTVVWAGTSGKVYKRKFVNEVFEGLDINKGFRYVYTEDKLLYYSALLKQPDFSSLDYKGYVYHNNATSITNKAQLEDPSFLISQLEFTTNKLKEQVLKAKLTKSESQFFDFFLNESVQNQISLMRRFEQNGENYIKHVWSAFKSIPDIKQIIRIVLYLFSCKKIKI